MKNTLIIFILSFALFSSCSEDNSPIDVPQPSGAILDLNVGGPSEPNQVWVALDVKNMKVTPRNAWDFGFYCGNEFRVIINTSLQMAAGKLDVTDIDSVSETDVASLKPIIAIGTSQTDNINYVDDVKGNYLQRTAIDAVNQNNDENKVYLINMGYDLYYGSSTSLNIKGEHRGWKKIRILRNGTNGYKIQYANLSDTTHEEFVINKKADYDFNFLSLEKGIADVQPPKTDWDLCYTVFVNEIPGHGTYSYSDFITTNMMNNVSVYMASVSEVGSYDAFERKNVDYTKFITDDQRVIGASWRTTFGGATAYTDRFYILKDHVGTLYKIRFIKLTDSNNNRGYPQFEFDVLN